VLLAAVAGALRRFLLEHGEEPRRLKAMVPVNVRDPQIQDGLGNHISFVFVGLPCTEPEPRARLADIAGQMRRRKEDREPEGADVALQGAGLAPRFVQGALAQLLASPRVFNLVVSNVPGPPIPLYLRGCRLRAVYPIVPLARDHALSIGMMTIAGRRASASTQTARPCPTRSGSQRTSMPPSTSLTRWLLRTRRSRDRSCEPADCNVAAPPSARAAGDRERLVRHRP
jgi:hypothetical protein